MKEHDTDIRLSRTQTSAISEHANKTGHYPLWDEVKSLTGTLVGLRWLSTYHFTLTTSTGTVELRFLKRGCVQSDNMTTDLYHSGPLRYQFLPLTMPTMLWIETHQPWARFVIHQSLTTTVVQIVRLSKSTLSPDEDLQCAVETSRSISKWQSWDKR